MTATGLPLLLAEDRWLRHLLRGLLHEHDAADAVQETWLRALRRTASGQSAGRAWLATVARNFARRALRSRSRQERRECAAAQAEAQPAADELVARLELQQRVARAVLALPEPFRSAVLLRYYEGLAPAAIAARLGVPAATVRTRVLRGLSLLRAELDQDGDQAWRAVGLILIEPSRASTAAVVAGGFLLGSKLVLGVAAVAVVALLVTFWNVLVPPSTGGVQGLPVPGGRGSERPASGVAHGDATVPRLPGREEVQTPAASAAPASVPAPPATMTLRGRVADTAGRPVPHALVGLLVVDGPYPGGGESEPDAASRFTELPGVGRVDHLGRAAADGSFAFALDPAGGRLHVLGEHATVRGISVPKQAGSQDGLILVAAAAIAVRGQVVDAQELPLAGVEVRIEEGPLARFPWPLDRTFAVEFAPVVTDAHGGFALDRVPGAPELRLHARKIGYREAEVPVPDAATTTLRLVLASLASDFVTLRGEVRSRAGQLVEGAWVVLGTQHTQSDARGRFELQIQRPLPEDALSLARVGYQPVVLPRFGAELQEWLGKVREVTLTLGPDALAISGQVLGPDGHSRANMRVVLVDPTWAGSGLSLEHIAAGSNAEAMGGPFLASTDAHGRFTATGLGARSYRLRVLDNRSLLAMVTEPIAAGTHDAVVRFPADAVRARLRGQVVRRTGAAVAGALIVPGLVLLANDTGSITITGDARTTADADGNFELRDVPRREIVLQVNGEDVVGAMVKVAPDHPDEGVRIQVASRCHFRIEPGARGEAADAVVFRDAAGKDVSATRMQEGGSFATTRIALQDGKSPVLSVSDEAETAVFWRGDQEVARRRVVLRPGEVTVIRM